MMLKKVSKQYLIASLIIFFGSIAWSITVVKSGWLYNFGLGFWGANGHDGIWHIALANNLANLNFDNPVFAGFQIQNYHLGFDLILALIYKLTSIPLNYLYFQILPPVFAILIGYLTYQFVFNWTKSRISSLCSLLFIYFGGSLSWIISKGESAFWSQQAVSTLINPPFALSLIFMLLGLISLQKRKMVFSIIFFGLLIQIKVYAGLLILGGLFVASLYNYYTERNTYYLKIFLFSLLLSSIIFIPFNLHPQSLINWQPFWFLETMMSYSDRVGWQKFYSAMTTFKMGNLWIKESLAYGAALMIFIVGNFWTRLIFIKDIFKKFDSLKLVFLSIIFAGTMIPMFFVQSGTPWNTIQFIYYSLFFSGILAGITVSRLPAVFLLFIFLVTIPTTYITLRDVYIPNRPPAKLTLDEIEGLSFLKNQPDGVVLTYPFDLDKAKEAISNPPRPLYLYESTSYVSAYSNKNVYLEDEVNLNIMNYDWNSRRNLIKDWYAEPDQKVAREFLENNQIKYIYWLKNQRALLGESQLGLVKIFENSSVIIYKNLFK